MKDDPPSFGKVEALLNPRNVVIVGASERPGNWALRVWRNLGRYGFPGPVYPFNPGRSEIWGTRCFRSFEELPDPPDHLVVLAPAAAVAATLRQGASAGARSATVMSAGFAETPGEEARRLAEDLSAAIEETGLAVSGPNCLGNFNVASRLFTMTDDRPHGFRSGPVAIFGQSGGIAMAIKRTLEERGVDAAALVTSGNEAGLTSADYISYFASRSDIKVVAGYVESIKKADEFLAACRMARSQGKFVVLSKLGASDSGRSAAAAHTGALAGSMEAFDAVAGQAGVIRARNLDDLVELVEFLTHCRPPAGARLGAVTFSGGMRGLLLDAADASGMSFGALADGTRERLNAILSVGSVIGNPLDAGFAALSSGEAYIGCVKALLDDPSVDLLLLQEELPRAPGSERKERNLAAVEQLATQVDKPVAFVSMISYALNDYARALRARLPHLAFLQEVERSVRILSTIALAPDPSKSAASPPPPTAEQAALLNDLLRPNGGKPLDEIASKRLLEAYGIESPAERLCRSEEDAAAFAARIGYPVAAKIVSPDIAHKSDMGGVRLDLASEAALRDAFQRILAAARALPGNPRIEGVLVSPMIEGGQDLILGLKRDPEMGPVIVFGSGGIDLELVRDVATAATPLDAEGARSLIRRTRAGALAAGYRGRPRLDEDRLIAALVGLSTLALHAGPRLEALDVNPFRLLERGGYALDALVVPSR